VSALPRSSVGLATLIAGPCHTHRRALPHSSPGLATEPSGAATQASGAATQASGVAPPREDDATQASGVAPPREDDATQASGVAPPREDDATELLYRAAPNHATQRSDGGWEWAGGAGRKRSVPPYRRYRSQPRAERGGEGRCLPGSTPRLPPP